jgi:hypothetical protein
MKKCRLLWTLGMKQDSWVRLLTYITGLVNQELLLQNEYLAAENRILRAQLPGRRSTWNPRNSHGGEPIRDSARLPSTCAVLLHVYQG